MPEKVQIAFLLQARRYMEAKGIAVFPQITGGEADEIGYGMTATAALQEAMGAIPGHVRFVRAALSGQGLCCGMSDVDVLSERERQLWTAMKRLSESALSAVEKDLEAATVLSGADFGILPRLEDLGAGHLAQAVLLAALDPYSTRSAHRDCPVRLRGEE